mmetsp:Transcript_173513/g.556505  ORF Transcript_173513/g.556505 Transcript_173513/m.556505 type:complete len:366 (-) Transcript_173513:72-1169(-)
MLIATLAALAPPRPSVGFAGAPGLQALRLLRPQLPLRECRPAPTHTAGRPPAVARAALGAPVRQAGLVPRLWRRIAGLPVKVLLLVLGPFLLLLDARKETNHRNARPKRIILVRHGESAGNVDKTRYQATPDSRMPLTEEGVQQATAAGERIRSLIKDESVRFFFSPYTRTLQTLKAILQSFRGNSVYITSEPRLREQDFGNFQNPQRMEEIYKERKRFGRFYYRFPDGEAGTDVYDRVAEFWSSLYRFMDQPSRWRSEAPIENFVVVTHGLLMRIFCMCYFRWTVAEFEQVWNPGNCEIWVLEKMPSGRYEIVGRMNDDDSVRPIKFGADQGQPLHEHMKSPLAAREVTFDSPEALDRMLEAYQ